MAHIIGIPTTTAGTAYTIASDTLFETFAGDTIVSTSSAVPAISVTGSANTLNVAGHIYSTGYRALLLGNGAADVNNTVNVFKDGILGSNAFGFFAVYVTSTASTIENAGKILGSLGIGTDSNVGLTLNNSGLIRAETTAVAMDGKLTNTGTIQSLRGQSFDGDNRSDKVTNKGLMIGTIELAAGADVYDGRSGRVAANVNGGEVRGEEGNDKLLGGKFVDRLNGGADDDKITGGLAKDILTGGTGRDQFIFNSKAECGDTITDFAVADDTIVLKASAFGGLPKGALSSAAFHASASGLAHDASDRFIYETDTDRLWFDANGNAAGGRILVADLNNVAFTRADILLI